MYIITEFSSQMSSYTHQKFHLGANWGRQLTRGAGDAPRLLPLLPSERRQCLRQFMRNVRTPGGSSTPAWGQGSPKGGRSPVGYMYKCAFLDIKTSI